MTTETCRGNSNIMETANDSDDGASMASACEMFEQPEQTETVVQPFRHPEVFVTDETTASSPPKSTAAVVPETRCAPAPPVVASLRPEVLRNILKSLSVSDCLGTGEVQLRASFEGLRYTTATVGENRTKNARPLKPISSLPEDVRKRLENWTTNKRQFSVNVIKHAKVKPLSHSYELGSVVSSGGGLGFGSSATTSDSLEVAGPENMMKLMWHKSWTGLKLEEDNKNTNDIIKVPQNLSPLYAEQLLKDISAIIKFDTDFSAEPDRFLGLKQLM